MFIWGFVAPPPREGVGGKPAKTGDDVPLPQKSDRRKLFLWLCEHTATGCGLGTGHRRRSRHALIKNIIINIILMMIFFVLKEQNSVNQNILRKWFLCSGLLGIVVCFFVFSFDDEVARKKSQWAANDETDHNGKFIFHTEEKKWDDEESHEQCVSECSFHTLFFLLFP